MTLIENERQKKKRRVNKAFDRIIRALKKRVNFPVDVFYVLSPSGSPNGGMVIIYKAGCKLSDEFLAISDEEYVGRYNKDYSHRRLKEDIAYHFGTPDALLPHDLEGLP